MDRDIRLRKCDYDEITDFLMKSRGFSLTPYKTNYVQKRIDTRLNATNCYTVDNYLEFLQNDKNEVNRLLNALTINFTSFYRNMEVYEFLEEHILPELIQRKLKNKDFNIHIWSCGCATGEEPYSIACILHRNIKIKFYSFNVNILASDVDANALNKAREAVYSGERLSKIDSKVIRACFNKKELNYQVKEELRDMIDFRKQNILSFAPIKIFFDIILCRNVLIYFDRTNQTEIFKHFLNSLKENGYMILGRAEMLCSKMRDNFKKISIENCVYQKL